MGPTVAQINHAHLIHNLQLIKQAVHPAGVMAVVKANAYGHGSVEVARTALANGATWLGVAFPEEGIELRKAGITAPILVFGAQLPPFFEHYLRFDLDLTLSARMQIEPLKDLCRRMNKKARVQIKVDTGMGRVGFLLEKDRDALLQILNEPAFEVTGVYSHLSSADEDDLGYTFEQVERFKAVREFVLKHSSTKPLFHLANSAAIMRVPQAYFDLVRPGVMLYGNPPGPDFDLQWDLKEVMRFVSRVAAVKELDANHPVSYNRRYYTSAKTKIAIIPAGYADGYNRRMTNTGQVLIRGKRYRIAGMVCMDQMMVDLGPDTDVRPGDEVVLFGPQGSDHVRIVEVARTLSTIPYEITCWVSARVPRIHINT